MVTGNDATFNILLMVLGIESKALRMLSKHSFNRAPPPALIEYF